MDTFKLTTTKDEFGARFRHWAQVGEVIDREELKESDIKAHIESGWNVFDSFGYLTSDELEQQLNDYEDSYLGENPVEGMLYWFDGECCCGLQCVESWLDRAQQSVNDKEKYVSVMDAEELAVLECVVGEMKKHQANTK